MLSNNSITGFECVQTRKNMANKHKKCSIVCLAMMQFKLVNLSARESPPSLIHNLPL